MNLTNEEIRIKVAEARGWNPSPLTKGKWCHDSNMSMARNGSYSVWVGKESLPNYPLDLNACAEFEATLTCQEYLSFRKHLWNIVITLGPEDTWDRQFVSADAKTRCLAYLKTKGILP